MVKKKKSEKEDPLDLANVVLHPTRRRIIDILRKGDSPSYIAQIANKLDIDEKLASFHLATLLQYELVEGVWGTTKTGKGGERAVKYYSLTKKAMNVLEKVKAWLD